MENKFEIGDDVICIDDRKRSGKPNVNPPPLVYKRIYKVLDKTICPSCGMMSLDVGLKSTHKNKHTTCNCGSQIVGKGIHWCDPLRFAKHTSQSASKEQTEALVKLEPKKVLEQLEIQSN